MGEMLVERPAVEGVLWVPGLSCGASWSPSTPGCLLFPPHSAWPGGALVSLGGTAFRRLSHEGQVHQHTARPGGQG